MSLNQLIENCKMDDTKAQSKLYKLFSSKLFAICLKYSRNYVEAEDNLQDAFLMVFKKNEQYNYKGSFEGWLKRITINTALQRYRNEKVFDIINENSENRASLLSSMAFDALKAKQLLKGEASKNKTIIANTNDENSANSASKNSELTIEEVLEKQRYH